MAHLYPPLQTRLRWQASLKNLARTGNSMLISVPKEIDSQASAKVIRGWGYQVSVEFWDEEDACLLVERKASA